MGFMSQRARGRRGGTGNPFDPSDVSGLLYWDPEDATFSPFALPEGSGVSARNMTEAGGTIATVTNNGFTQLSLPAGVSMLDTAVALGNTGSFVMAGWVKLPNGTPSGTYRWHAHDGSGSANGPYVEFVSGGQIRFWVSEDGSAIESHRYDSAMTNSNWRWAVAEFDSTNATATERLSFFLDDVELTPSVTSSVDTTLNDPAVQYRIGQLNDAGIQIGVQYYCPRNLSDLGAATLASIKAYKAPI